MTRQPARIWQQLHWHRPVEPARAVGALRQLAADPRSPQLILETRATDQGIVNLLGGHPAAVRQAVRLLQHVVPGTSTSVSTNPRRRAAAGARLKASTRHRPLRVDDPLLAVRALASALAQVRRREELVVQVILGPRRVPLAVPTNSPSSTVAPLVGRRLAWQRQDH